MKIKTTWQTCRIQKNFEEKEYNVKKDLTRENKAEKIQIVIKKDLD